jgi:hypothetical protein
MERNLELVSYLFGVNNVKKYNGNLFSVMIYEKQWFLWHYYTQREIFCYYDKETEIVERFIDGFNKDDVLKDYSISKIMDGIIMHVIGGLHYYTGANTQHTTFSKDVVFIGISFGKNMTNKPHNITSILHLNNVFEKEWGNVLHEIIRKYMLCQQIICKDVAKMIISKVCLLGYYSP